MKKLLQIIVCFIHPLAVVLAWINLLGRSDLGRFQKVAWAIFLLVPIVPFIYVLAGGELW
jgi:NADH:ubiquinone oxidoreductase subunit 3 (subunit A)